MARRANDFSDANLQQACIRLAMVRESSRTLRMPQRDGVGPERPGARRIGRTKKPNRGNAQCTRQMQRAGVSTEEDTRATSQRDQFSDIAANHERVTMTRFHDGPAQTSSARPGV